MVPVRILECFQFHLIGREDDLRVVAARDCKAEQNQPEQRVQGQHERVDPLPFPLTEHCGSDEQYPIVTSYAQLLVLSIANIEYESMQSH